jgi:hypothetical protein
MGFGTKIKSALHSDKSHNQTASTSTTSRPQKAPGAYPESVNNTPRTVNNDTLQQQQPSVADNKPLPEIERGSSLDSEMGDYTHHTAGTHKRASATHPKSSNLVAEAEAMEARPAGTGDVRDNKSHPYWGDVGAKNNHVHNKTAHEPNFPTFGDDHTDMSMNRTEKNHRLAANEPINHAGHADHLNHNSRHLDNDVSMMHGRNMDGKVGNNGLRSEEPLMNNKMNHGVRSEEPLMNNKMHHGVRSEEPLMNNKMHHGVRSEEPLMNNKMHHGVHSEEPLMNNNMHNMNSVPHTEDSFRGNNMNGMNGMNNMNNMNTTMPRTEESFRGNHMNNMNTAMPHGEESLRGNHMNSMNTTMPRNEDSLRGNNMSGFNAPMGSMNRGHGHHHQQSIGGHEEDPAFGHSGRYDDSYSKGQSDMRFGHGQNQSPSMMHRDEARGLGNGAHHNSTHHNGMGAAGAAGAMGAASAMNRGHNGSISGSDHSADISSNKMAGSDHYGPGHSGAKVMHQCQSCGHDNDISKYFSKDVIYRMS